LLDAYVKATSGAAGAVLWMIAVYGVQTSLTAARGDLRWTATLQTMLGVVGLVACCTLLGAAAPFVVDAQSAKEAVAEGLGWQGVFGQFAKPLGRVAST
jgi:hypothetical protein